MDKIQLIGIGNALVDIEFEVTEDFLQDHHIIKGQMTLIDASTHKQISHLLSEQFQVKKQSGGGSAANSTVIFSQLGGLCRYCCRVAKDDFGHFYVQDLKDQGVQCDPIYSNEVTGKCLVLVTPDAERTMLTYLGTTAHLCDQDIDFSQIEKAQWLFMEGYLLTMENSFKVAKEAVKKAKQCGTKIALSCSDPFVVSAFQTQMMELLSNGIDLLFANEEEMKICTAESDLVKACESLQDQCHKIVVTLGDKGCAVYTSGKLSYYEGVSTDVVDTNGAGDAFAGAYLFATLAQWQEEERAQLGNRVAAKVIAHFGARAEQSLIKQCASSRSVPS